MVKQEKIKLPIIFDNPLAPAGRIDICFDHFKIFFYLFLVVSTSILLHTKFELAWVLTLFVSIPISCIIAWILYRILYGGHVIIRNNTLSIQSSLLHNKVDKVFPIKNYEKILWVVQETNFKRTIDSLFLAGKKSSRETLVESFHVFKTNKQWHNFINKLSKATGLPVEKVVHEIHT